MYDCNCDKCKAEKINLSADADADPKFKSVLKAGENAFKHLHKKGGYKPEDIAEKPYQKLIEETYKVFDIAIRDNEVPEEMLAKLQNDTFIFSGLKTHAQLLEASTMLTDDKGKIRSFESFANEFNKINKNYNQNYLEAEHQFAVSSSQSAANWAALEEDGRYYLQYRTANDDRVRDSHAVLQDTTLPKDDAFWLSYYPPNGWRCRCVAVEVLRDKYKLSDSAKSLQLGEKATTQIGADGKNKLEIFRFNPGAEQKVFPPKHPYNKVKGAEEAKESLTEQPSKFETSIDILKKTKVEYNEVKVLEKQLTENEIIEKVGGGDLTKGSCASLSFAYAGNKAGFDVLDFRDGESRAYFARNIDKVIDLAGGFVEKDYNDFKAIGKLLKNTEVGKEYILSTGRHASIIRKDKEKGWEYLELQSPKANGYKPLTNEKLKSRFDCKTKRTTYGTKVMSTSSLIDIEQLNNEDFKNLLGYINTDEDKQNKGDKGKTR